MRTPFQQAQEAARRPYRASGVPRIEQQHADLVAVLLALRAAQFKAIRRAIDTLHAHRDAIVLIVSALAYVIASLPWDRWI